MMKKFNLFLGGLMAIAFTACTNDDLLPEGNSNGPSAEQVTITAYTPGNNNPSSRIAQGNYVVGETIPLSWDNDDQISVFFAGETKTYTKSDKGENTFTGDEFEDNEGKYFAFYPALAAAVQEGIVPFDLSDQTGADAYLMYAVSDNHSTYQFQHAAAYLKATFPETLKNTTATITLTLPEGVYTKGTIDLEDFTLESNNEYKNTIVKTVVFGDETPVVWFAIPPMAANNNTLNFKIKTADKNYRATLAGSAEKAIEAGKYYSASITMTEGLNTCTLRTDAYYYMQQAASGKTPNSIVFNANSTRSTSDPDAQIVAISTIKAYAKVEGTTLYVYTEADEFVFNESSYGLFSDLSTVQTINFNNCINTSNVTSMSNMFKGCAKLKSLDLSSFDTSKVTNMEAMFQSCTALESLDLSSFNTSNVTDIDKMFSNCSALTFLDLSSFDKSSKLESMDNMFQYCTALESLDLSKFNTSNVKYMSYVFMGCTALESLDLSSFNTSNVQYMTNVFLNCTALKSLDLSKFNTSNVKQMTNMFRSCTSLQSLDLCNFTLNCIPNASDPTGYTGMLSNCNNLTNVYVNNSNKQTKLQSVGTGIDSSYIKVCPTHGAL